MSTRILAAVAVLFCNLAFGGDATVGEDGTVTWQAGVDNVEIVWEPDGSMKRLYSRYGVPVEFADRRGIHKGYVIAEEKAKANIIRFLNQSISSSRVVTEIQSELNKATQTREGGNVTSQTKVDERQLIESLTEVTTSFASGKLRGVIVLEQGFDEKTSEAWVVVGISKRTMASANSLEKALSNPGNDQVSETVSGRATQGSETRRSHQKDW